MRISSLTSIPSSPREAGGRVVSRAVVVVTMSNLSFVQMSEPSRIVYTSLAIGSQMNKTSDEWPAFRCYVGKFWYFQSQSESSRESRVEARNAAPPPPTGALGYRVCGVTGPGSYANYSLTLAPLISEDFPRCSLPSPSTPTRS